MPSANLLKVVRPLNDYAVDRYHYGFNGQMKVNEWAGIGNHNIADFWEYDTRTGRRDNQDPKPNASVSNYATFDNSPIINKDSRGDSVDVSGIYKKDDHGELVNKQGVLAFELYASTADGQKYLLDHAQKGFSLQGTYVKGLNINATENGKLSDVDASFELGYYGPGGAVTRANIVNGRLKLLYMYPNEFKEGHYWNNGNESIMQDVNVIAHEPHLHGVLTESRFRNGEPVIQDEDHANRFVSEANFLDVQEKILTQAQVKLLNSEDVRTTTTPVSISNLRMMIQVGRSNSFDDLNKNTGVGSSSDLTNYIKSHRQ